MNNITQGDLIKSEEITDNVINEISCF